MLHRFHNKRDPKKKNIALYKTVESCNRLVIQSKLKKIESNKA